jgi:integrase
LDTVIYQYNLNLNKYFSKYESLVQAAIEREFDRAHRSEITHKAAENFESRSRRHVLGHFRARGGEDFSASEIHAFVDSLRSKGLASPTIRQVLQCFKKIHEYGVQKGLYKGSINLPKISQKNVPRGGFSPKEYLTLYRGAKQFSKRQPQLIHICECEAQTEARGAPARSLYGSKDSFPDYFHLMISFMVNSFLRPGDLKRIRYKHIEVADGARLYLRLRIPDSKGHGGGCVITMPRAARAYRLLMTQFGRTPQSDPEDYLFYPEWADRDAVMMAMGIHFRRLLESTGLREGVRGQTRTLYSLRHTAIMNRLKYGARIDLLTLARNARTSVQMIDKFYAADLTAEMNVRQLHARAS